MTNRNMTLDEFATRGMNAQAEIDRLCRTNDPQTSKDAAEKMVKSGALNRQEKLVIGAIIGYVNIEPSVKGFTTKDIAKYMSKFCQIDYYKAYDICRKRFSGLEDKGKIDVVWEQLKIKRREGCRVWKLL